MGRGERVRGGMMLVDELKLQVTRITRQLRPSLKFTTSLGQHAQNLLLVALYYTSSSAAYIAHKSATK